MRAGVKKFGSANLTRKKAENALTALLYGCTAERLAGFTAEGLSGSYNVPLARSEQMLTEARRRRANG